MFKLLRDDKGQMLPFIAFMMVIILLFASFTISTTMMFLERKKAEDALDAAVISAILADAKEKHMATHYSDGLRKVCTDGYWRTGSYTDADGNSHTYSYWVCTDWYWRVQEYTRYPKNYIYFNDRGTALKYFEKNLDANSNYAKIESFSLEVEYDDERFLLVRNDIEYMNPPGSHPRDGKPIVGRSSNPTWWHKEFGGTVGFLGEPPAFTTSDEREDRIVRFPRWVKVSATAQVRVPSLMGNVLGSKNTTLVTVNAEAVRELLEIDKPHYEWKEEESSGDTSGQLPEGSDIPSNWKEKMEHYLEMYGTGRDWRKWESMIEQEKIEYYKIIFGAG